MARRANERVWGRDARGGRCGRTSGGLGAGAEPANRALSASEGTSVGPTSHARNPSLALRALMRAPGSVMHPPASRDPPGRIARPDPNSPCGTRPRHQNLPPNLAHPDRPPRLLAPAAVQETLRNLHLSKSNLTAFFYFTLDCLYYAERQTLNVVIPSAARNLARVAARCFAALSMTFNHFRSP